MDNIDIEKKINKPVRPVLETGSFHFEQENIDKKREILKKNFEKDSRREEKEEKNFQVGVPKSGSGVGAPGIDTTDSFLHQNIESILESGLEDIYLNMDKKNQESFKIKGEETAQKIIELIKTGKNNFKKVFKLIFSWLRIIPGVNKFFIEQESKLRAEKINKIDL